jgi:hypothetical protein
MTKGEAYNKIEQWENRLEEEVIPTCSTNTELMVAAQTIAIIVYIKAMLADKIKEESNGNTTR